MSSETETTQSETQSEETTTTATTEEQKTPQTLLNEPVPPPVYEPLTPESLIFPEGFTVDETFSTEFISVANEYGLTPDQANKLIELHAKTQHKALEADSAAWDTTQKEWREAVEADPEIGGARWPVVRANIGKLIDEYGSDDFREAMELTGAGNNPHFVKFLAKVANKLTEPKMTQGAPKPAGDLTPAQRLYPSMKG